MEFKKYFKEENEKSYRCTIKKRTNSDNVVQENECGDIVSVSKGSFWNLKRHISRKHESVLREHAGKEAKG